MDQRHLFSLFCPPPSSLSLNYECPSTLGSGEPRMEGGMQDFHLLFINTGSGNTPHCQPNPLSLHLVPWLRGAAMTRYRAPDVPWMRGVLDDSYACLVMKSGWDEVIVMVNTGETLLSTHPVKFSVSPSALYYSLSLCVFTRFHICFVLVFFLYAHLSYCRASSLLLHAFHSFYKFSSVFHNFMTFMTL